MRGGSKSAETQVSETPLKGRRIWQELPALPWEIWVEDNLCGKVCGKVENILR